MFIVIKRFLKSLTGWFRRLTWVLFLCQQFWCRLPTLMLCNQVICFEVWSGNVKDLRTNINVFSLSSPLSLSVTPTRSWSKHPQHWRQICSGSRRPFSQGRPHWSVPLLHFTLYLHFYREKSYEHMTEWSCSLQIVIESRQCDVQMSGHHRNVFTANLGSTFTFYSGLKWHIWRHYGALYFYEQWPSEEN